MAFSCGIELCDEELLRNYSQKDFNRPYSETTSGLLGILCEKLWGEIESYYAFTTHEKIVRITERGENETNEWGRFYDNVMKGVKIEE